MPEQWLNLIAVVGGSLIATIIMLTYAPAMLVKWLLRRDLQARARGRLVLTFDDGPGRSMTPPLLAMLAQHNATASFFLVGFRAQRDPQTCDLLARSGHELGCHTTQHRRPWLMLPWNAMRDMRRGYEALSSWIAPDASFRPPFGQLTTWTWLEALRRGARVCMWTIDGCDTHAKLPPIEQVVRNVVDQRGGVILLHSHDRGDDRQQYVLALTEALLVAAKQHRLQVCALPELYRENPSRVSLEEKVA